MKPEAEPALSAQNSKHFLRFWSCDANCQRAYDKYSLARKEDWTCKQNSSRTSFRQAERVQQKVDQIMKDARREAQEAANCSKDTLLALSFVSLTGRDLVRLRHPGGLSCVGFGMVEMA